MVNSVTRRIKVALQDRFSSGKSSRFSRSGVVAHPEDNLVDSVKVHWPEIKGELLAESPSPLKPQNGFPATFCNVNSSTALAVNTFGYFKGADTVSQLRLGNTSGFEWCCFERKAGMGNGFGMPQIDFYAIGKGNALAVESKMCEYLYRADNTLYRYDNVLAVKRIPKEMWRDRAVQEMFLTLWSQPERYTFLRASQLLKQIMGLKHMFRDRKLKIVLAYIYWEPSGMLRNSPVCQRHRLEIRDFQRRMSECSVSFVAMTYKDLWNSWLSTTSSPSLRKHIKGLVAKYSVAIDVTLDRPLPKANKPQPKQIRRSRRSKQQIAHHDLPLLINLAMACRSRYFR